MILLLAALPISLASCSTVDRSVLAQAPEPGDRDRIVVSDPLDVGLARTGHAVHAENLHDANNGCYGTEPTTIPIKISGGVEQVALLENVHITTCQRANETKVILAGTSAMTDWKSIANRGKLGIEIGAIFKNRNGNVIAPSWKYAGLAETRCHGQGNVLFDFHTTRDREFHEEWQSVQFVFGEDARYRKCR